MESVYADNYVRTASTDFCFAIGKEQVWCSRVEIARRSGYFRTVFSMKNPPNPYIYVVKMDATADEFKNFLDIVLGVSDDTMIDGDFYELAQELEFDKVCAELENNPFMTTSGDGLNPFRHLPQVIRHCKDMQRLDAIATELVEDHKNILTERWFTNAINGSLIIPLLLKCLAD